jgi:hypothetical protein
MYNIYYFQDNSAGELGIIKGRLYRLKLMDKFLFILNKNNSSEINLSRVESYYFFTMFSENETVPENRKIFDYHMNNKLLNLLNNSKHAKLDYILDEKMINTQKNETRYFIKLYP